MYDMWALVQDFPSLGGDFVCASSKSSPCPVVLSNGVSRNTLHTPDLQQQQELYSSLFLPLTGNLKSVVFSVPRNAEWLEASDICPVVDFVVFWKGCIEKFGSMWPPVSSKPKSSCKGSYSPHF